MFAYLLGKCRPTISSLANSLSLVQKSAFSKALPKDRKRFYKNVSISESFSLGAEADKKTVKYEINLDKKKLKTPSGKLFQVENETLANLISQEWHSQDNVIHLSMMHLTTLANTCQDNPFNLTSKQIIDKMKEYLITDTVLYRELDNASLLELQEEKWTPLVDWMNERFPKLNLKMKGNHDLHVDGYQTNLDFDELERYLNSFNLNSLVAINFICETLKSVILTLALMNGKLDSVDTACTLSLLESQYQQIKWGKVEWQHGFEEAEMKTRVSAALLFSYFNSNTHHTKEIN